MNSGLQVKTSFGEVLQRNPDIAINDVGKRLAITAITSQEVPGQESTLQGEFGDTIRALFMPFVDHEHLKPEAQRNPEKVRSKLESLKKIVPPVIDELLKSLSLVA